LAHYLIDSHIFLWAIDAPERLLASERRALSDTDNDIAVSVAAFWELSIKISKGLLPIGRGKAAIGKDYFAKQAEIAGFRILPLDSPEAEYMRQLPRIHADPFDRILIAQALLSRRIIMTRDRIFSNYPGVHTFES
jgi:PIN domain nuclease of toxin-antitoxin system